MTSAPVTSTFAPAPGSAAEGQRRARRRWPWVLACVVAAGVTTGALLAASARTSHSDTQLIESFFDRYLGADGRVARVDQGGDTVSEGQAYAMLLAVAAKDRSRFAAAWGWTDHNLRRPDGLLAWHWDGGRIVDSMPAADADLDAAWALTLAGQRFHDSGWAAAGRAMAGAIAAQELVRAAGHPVLIAGPWAASTPAVVNPGYWAAPALDALARDTADPVWRSTAATARAVNDAVTGGGRRLPSDWAFVDSPSGARPAPPPDDPGGQARFGLDAARLLVWEATSCDAGDRHRAASALPLLSSGGPGVMQRELDGRAAATAVHPLMHVAAAAAAGAAGHASERTALLREAAAEDRRHPTYYGAAWVALGHALLTGGALGGCAGTA